MGCEGGEVVEEGGGGAVDCGEGFEGFIFDVYEEAALGGSREERLEG